jgi:hypothetical protein
LTQRVRVRHKRAILAGDLPMPFLIALLGAIAAAYVWYARARNAAEMTQELANVASDVMSAARRFGFRRKQNLHPVESLDDTNVAIGALGVAYLELDGLPTAEQRGTLVRAMQTHCYLDHPGAEEALILGRWLVSESQGPQMAVPRLARRLAKLDRQHSFEPLMAVLRDVAAAKGGATNDRQREALEDIARAFGVA